MTVVPFFEDGRYETKWENCFQKYEYNLHNWEMPHLSVSNKSPIREVVFGRLATLVVYARPFTDLSQSTKIHEYIQLLWKGKLEK